MKSVAMAAILILSGWLLPAGAEETCLTIKKITPNFDALRQGTELLVTAEFKAHECGVPVADFGPNSEHLSLQPVNEPGLTITPVRFDFHDGKAGRARKVLVTLKIKADRDAALGAREIQTSLSYRAAHEAGEPAVQELPLKIPVKVVEAGARVNYLSAYDHRPSKWNLTWEIPLAVALLPVVLPLMMLGVFPDC